MSRCPKCNCRLFTAEEDAAMTAYLKSTGWELQSGGWVNPSSAEPPRKHKIGEQGGEPVYQAVAPPGPWSYPIEEAWKIQYENDHPPPAPPKPELVTVPGVTYQGSGKHRPEPLRQLRVPAAAPPVDPYVHIFDVVPKKDIATAAK